LKDWAQGDFSRCGKDAYLAHYERQEGSCHRNDREFLDWSVEDGWEPLCSFLDRPVPEETFPHDNAAGQQCDANMECAIGGHVKNALIRSTVRITVAGVAGVAIVLRLR